MADPTEALLAERKTTHGDYRANAELSQGLKWILRSKPSWEKMGEPHREALDMIVHKIARIMNGDPDVADHWDDIAGYAKLVSKDIAGVKRGI